MDDAVVDRRREHRFPPPPATNIAATIRPGCQVVLIDVSEQGALIEAPRPLRPGGRIHLLVSAGDARQAITAVVLRCAVAAIEPTGGVTYRGGLAFDTCVQWPWALPTHRRTRAREHERPERSGRGHVLPAQGGSQVSAASEPAK